MKCRECDYKAPANSIFCPNCGAKFVDDDSNVRETKDTYEVVEEVNTKVYTSTPNFSEEKTNNPDDSGSVGWGILGFFFPLVGFILFLVWLKEKPKSSKAVGIGALIRVILNLLFVFFILFIFGTLIGYSSYYTYY